MRRRVAAGRWHRVLGAGLSGRPGPFSEWQRAWAVQLGWPGAVTSHRSAAILLGFPVSPDGLTYVLAGRGDRLPAGVVRRVAEVGDDLVSLDGLLVTGTVRTAVDCLASLPPDEALDLFAWLSTRQLLDRTALAAACRTRYGRDGTPQLVRLLSATATGAVSPGEARLHRLLRAAGVAGWAAGVRVDDADGVIGVVDLLFAGARVVVEVDGRRAHSRSEEFVHDRRRQNRLVLAGYLVLRFTWDDLVARPDAVVRQIVAAVAARTPGSSISR